MTRIVQQVKATLDLRYTKYVDQPLMWDRLMWIIKD